MYTPSTQHKNELVIADPSAPKLVATDSFRRLIATLPNSRPVPMSIIKLGLLTNHLEPKPDSVVSDLSAIKIDATRTVPIPSETHTAIVWLLANHCESLTQRRKEKVGKLCEAANLNAPSETEATNAAIDTALPNSYAQQPGVTCPGDRARIYMYAHPETL